MRRIVPIYSSMSWRALGVPGARRQLHRHPLLLLSPLLRLGAAARFASTTPTGDNGAVVASDSGEASPGRGGEGSEEAAAPAESRLGVFSGADGSAGDADADADAPFDEVEASLQEVHDLTFAMVQHLNNIHPLRSWRGHQKQTHMGLHAIVERRQAASTYSHSDMKRGCELFDQMSAKLLPLITEEVLQRAISSASLRSRQLHRDSGRTATSSKRNTNIVVRNGTWRSNVLPRMHQHAPFEVEQLRSDMPESVVAATRGLRDMNTVKNLIVLMDRPNPIRSTLEDKCWPILGALNPAISRV